MHTSYEIFIWYWYTSKHVASSLLIFLENLLKDCVSSPTTSSPFSLTHTLFWFHLHHFTGTALVMSLKISLLQIPVFASKSLLHLLRSKFCHRWRVPPWNTLDLWHTTGCLWQSFHLTRCSVPARSFLSSSHLNIGLLQGSISWHFLFSLQVQSSGNWSRTLASNVVYKLLSESSP